MKPAGTRSRTRFAAFEAGTPGSVRLSASLDS